MSNELIVIEQSNAVAVLSTSDGIDALLMNVRNNIDSMDGGSMKNKTSRAKIKSNAFKATKAFTKINDENITPLINDLTAKIQPEIDIINAIKANRSALQEGLKKIRKDVNAEVDAFESELQRVKDEKAELERIALIDKDWDFAQMLMKEYFALVERGLFEIEHINKLAEEKAEQEKIAHEKLIAAIAAKQAKLEAEKAAEITIMHVEAIAENNKRDSIKAKEEAESQRQAAIQADIEADELREQAKLNAIKVEEERVNREAELAINQAKAVEIEKQQSAQREIKAAENARIAEVNRQAYEKAKSDAITATRVKNSTHRAAVKTRVKESLIANTSCTLELAIEIVNALSKNKIDDTTINF